MHKSHLKKIPLRSWEKIRDQAVHNGKIVLEYDQYGNGQYGIIFEYF